MVGTPLGCCRILDFCRWVAADWLTSRLRAYVVFLFYRCRVEGQPQPEIFANMFKSCCWQKTTQQWVSMANKPATGLALAMQEMCEPEDAIVGATSRATT